MAGQRRCNEKAQSRERDSERRTRTGSPTEMEKKATWREEEQQQKEEGAGQRPKMKNGEQEGDAKQKTCSMTEEKRIGAGTRVKRDEEIECNKHGESSRSVTCYGAKKKGLESSDKEPDREHQSKNTDRL